LQKISAPISAIPFIKVIEQLNSNDISQLFNGVRRRELFIENNKAVVPVDGEGGLKYLRIIDTIYAVKREKKLNCNY
jgi:hypothetical protein